MKLLALACLAAFASIASATGFVDFRTQTGSPTFPPVTTIQPSWPVVTDSSVPGDYYSDFASGITYRTSPVVSTVGGVATSAGSINTLSIKPQAAASTPPSIPTFVTPFNHFAGSFVGIDSRHWAAVVATPYAIWPLPPFKLFGHTFTGVQLDADLLAGAIFSGGQFTFGQSFGFHYSWHPEDYLGFGVAQLYSSLKPVYKPFVEVGWNF